MFMVSTIHSDKLRIETAQPSNKPDFYFDPSPQRQTKICILELHRALRTGLHVLKRADQVFVNDAVILQDLSAQDIIVRWHFLRQ